MSARPIRPFREVFALKVEQARRIALSLPEVVEAPHHELSSFRIRGKIFATVPPNGKYLHVFVDEQRREAVVAAEPSAFEKLWWGSKVVGVRVVLAKARPSVVSGLLYSAWCRKAPRRLVTSFAGSQKVLT
jgi:hypothetical protein